MSSRDQRGPQGAIATVVSLERTEGDTDALLATLREALTDRLRVVGLVGSGGMGTLDLVLDRALERQVVVKRIHEDLLSDGATMRMFVREAQITGQLEHPGIVPVHELGLDGSQPYFAMKLVEGATLEARIRELPEGPIEHGRLLDLLDAVLRVCEALAFAHSRGVIHCDVKPANVMVGEYGQVYLMDWGIAQRIGGPPAGTPPSRGAGPAESGASEAEPALVGTPTHMAPEQALGDRCDERTDVFLVGTLLYQLLARRSPYASDNVWAAVTLAQTASHPPLSTLAPHAPPLLVRIIERAMAREPSARYQTVEALRAELLNFVRGNGVFATRQVAAGELVVREGDAADAAYIIEAGRLEAFQGEGESRRVLRTMGPGEVFGEMAILSPGPRTASVVAVEGSLLRVVTAAALQDEMRGLKPWMSAFVRTLAQRFREREQSR